MVLSTLIYPFDITFLVAVDNSVFTYPLNNSFLCHCINIFYRSVVDRIGLIRVVWAETLLTLLLMQCFDWQDYYTGSYIYTLGQKNVHLHSIFFQRILCCPKSLLSCDFVIKIMLIFVFYFDCCWFSLTKIQLTSWNPKI